MADVDSALLSIWLETVHVVGAIALGAISILILMRCFRVTWLPMLWETGGISISDSQTL